MPIRRTLRVCLPLLALIAAPARPAFSVDWETTSLPSGYQYSLAVDAGGRVYAYGGAAVHASDDDGAHWTAVGPIRTGVFAHALACSPGGSLFAADIALGVFRSDDGGLHWTDDLVTEGCDGIAVGPDGIAYAGLTYTGNGKVHRSSNNGTTWQGVPLPGSPGNLATRCFAFGDSGETYAGQIDGPYRSVDAGLTWERRASGLLGTNVRTMAVAPNQHLFIETLYPAQFDGLYRSLDRGRTWSRVPGNAGYFAAMIASRTGDLVGAGNATVSRSIDEGLTWTPYASGLPANENYTSLVETPTGRRILGGYHVYRTTSTVLSAEDPARSAALELGAAQPNPFARATRIPFTLARPADVELAVFDVSGRRVATLVSGALGAGAHVATWNGEGLRAGVYVCRLAAGGQVLTRRLLLTR